MAHYRLSKVADKKIYDIYEYSILRFGENRADEYFIGMHEMFAILAERPLLGRECPDVGNGIRRFIYHSHIIYYRADAEGILVVDIFGDRQIPTFVSGR